MMLPGNIWIQYGNPRYVENMITQDKSKFRPINEGEDSRFLYLVHLVRRSFNTFKEDGRGYDMDGNHMLEFIERKLLPDDRKVWARYLESTKSQATLESLITWLTNKMKTRMRVSASLRSSSYGIKVHHIQENNSSSHKCWLCETSEHWID